MTVLRVVRASFVRGGEELVAPFDLEQRCGERVELFSPDARAAALTARIAAAVVKPTSGAVFIGDYDARLQAAQAKRCVAFVPAGSEAPPDFPRALDLYAAAFGVARAAARKRAAAILDALGSGGYARNAALALSHDAPLVVLDRPPPGVAEAIAAFRPGAAIFISSVAPAVAAEAPGAERVLEALH